MSLPPRSHAARTHATNVQAGLENYGAVTLRVSGLRLPPGARLRSFRARGILEPMQWATVADFSSDTAFGALVYVYQRLESGNAFCLEGTHVANVTHDGHTQELSLSSGFEDYFLSGQYFVSALGEWWRGECSGEGCGQKGTTEVLLLTHLAPPTQLPTPSPPHRLGCGRVRHQSERHDLGVLVALPPRRHRLPLPRRRPGGQSTA